MELCDRESDCFVSLVSLFFLLLLRFGFDVESIDCDTWLPSLTLRFLHCTRFDVQTTKYYMYLYIEYGKVLCDFLVSFAFK